MIRWVLGLLAISWCSLADAQDRPISVTFINPGFSNEPFWVDYSRYMHDAADDLGIRLQVLYAERDVTRALRQARHILQARERPDYLIFANEWFIGPEVLRLFADSGIKLFALHSTLSAEQQALAGGSRERYANWIGSLVPNDEEAGYLMGKAIIELAQGKPAELLAFSGVKQTPSATLRLNGLQRALAEGSDVRLVQALYGEWKEERAYEQASALLPRYPDLGLIWSANDEMAFGVMRAAEELGRTLRYTALNNSARVLQARREGRIDVLATGHFLLGACALVMLHDYAKGMDFAERGGKDQTARLMRLIDGDEAERLARRLGQAQLNIDFARFSAVNDPQIQRYACSIDPLLD